MPRVTQGRPPEQLEAIVEAISELRAAMNMVEFGDPGDPNDAGSSTLAGSSATAHNGALQNIRGSWASASVTALDTAVTFHHNLEVPLVGAGIPNVMVVAQRIQHSGQGASGISPISWNFETGDTITSTSIQLRFYAAARTVNGTHPLAVSLFFTPSVR